MKPKVLKPEPEFLQHILVHEIRDIPLRRDYIESRSDSITVTEGAELYQSGGHGAWGKERGRIGVM